MTDFLSIPQHQLRVSGNTAGATASLSSGTVTLAGGNNITLSQAGNAVTISGAAAAGAQTAISGVAASNTTYTSGTVTFTGVGGGVTVSSNTGQRVDISVAAQSVQPETQTFIAGIQNSQTTYTSGTVNLSVVAGNLTIRSTTGQAFQFSASQTVQTQGGFLSAGVSTGGNTAGNTQVSTGSRLVLAGAGNISLSQSTAAGASTVSISGSQSVQPETQTFVGGIAASNTTYTSGTITITGVGGGITVSSNTGQRVDLSVAAQSVQTQDVLSVGASNVGNTSGNTTVNTGSRLVFAGGNNITISQGTAAGATTLTISGPNVGGAQTGISGLANSQTTYTSGSVTFSELGAITIRSTTGQQFQFSVNAQSVQPETQTAISGIANSQTTYTSGTVSLSELGAITVRSTTGNQFQLSVNAYSAGISTNGNTAGDTGFASHRLALIGGNNITLSGSTNAGSMSLTISGPTVGGAQTGISGIANSQTTYTSGTVSLSELGAITIRSTTGNQYQLSVNAQSVQPETQTFVAGIQNSQTTYTSGTVNLSVVAGNLTIRSTTGQAFQFSASQSVQPETQTAISGIANSQTTYTSGTVSWSELGAVTIRSTTGQQYQISVNSQSVQTQGIGSLGVSTGGNTAGNTQVSTGSRIVFAGVGDISLSQATAAGASTISISGSQSVQTQGIGSIGVSTGGNTAGNTQVSTGSRFVLVASGNATASQATAAGASTVTISVGAQTAQTQSNIQALYDGANSISTGTIRVTNANGVSFSVNGQTLSASVNDSISMFAVSNTTQSTTGAVHKSVMSFAGAGIASVGVTGNSVLISVPAGGGAGDGGVFAGASTMGNTAGSTGTVSTGNFVLVGTGPISLSQSTGAAGSAATVSINAPATSSLSATGAFDLYERLHDLDWSASVHCRHRQHPDFHQRFHHFHRGRRRGFGLLGQHGARGVHDISVVERCSEHLAVESGERELPRLHVRPIDLPRCVRHRQHRRGVHPFHLDGVLHQGQLDTVVAVCVGSGDVRNGGAAAGITNSFGGRRWITIHSSAFNMPPTWPPNDYFLALWERSSSGSQTVTYQGQLLPYATGVRSGIMGAASSTNTTLAHYPFLGNYSVSFSTAMPNTLAASDVNASNATAVSLPRIIFNNVGSNIV